MSRANFLLREIAAAKAKDTRQRDAEKAAALLARLFPAQRDFVTDPARRKAALCPRQSGKSYSVLTYALHTALTRSDARVLVLARVRRQAKGVYWSLVKRLASEFELGAKFRNMELEVELPNGSLIQFAGADTQEEVDKYRGQQFDLVCIDECKSYSSRLLRELINEIIRPTVLARNGVIVMIGTPGPLPNGPFYTVTTGDLGGVPKSDRGYWSSRHWRTRAEKKTGWAWSAHGWTAADNVACPQIWERALADKELSGVPDDDPVWLREMMGQWVPDEDALVFAYARIVDGRCDWAPEEDGPFGLSKEHEWRYVLGIDLGVRDATAFVVGAWSPTHPALHIIHAEKHVGFVIDDVVKHVKKLTERYKSFDSIVADTGNLGLMIVDSLRRTYGIPVTAAKKSEKLDHIALMNSDMLGGRIKIDPESPLAEEWRTVQWSGHDRSQIDPSCDDDLADAALYLWRHVYHHFSEEKKTALVPGTDEWWARVQADEEERFRRELLSEDKPWWHKFKPEEEDPWILSDSKDSLL